MRWQAFCYLLCAQASAALAAEPISSPLLDLVRQHGGRFSQEPISKLADIDLSGTEATDDVFAKQLPIGIRRLDISYSQLSGAAVRRIADQRTLQQLEAMDSSIADVDLPYLADATELKHLWLERTRVTSAGLIGIERFPTLETLFIDGKYSDTALEHLIALSQPAHLRIISNDSTGEFLALPGAKERLRQLQFTATPIGNQGLSKLRDAKHLHTLYLSYSKVNDIGLEPLQKLPKLQTLLLTNNQIEGRGLANFNDLKCLIVKENLRPEQLAGLSTLQALEHLSIDAPGCGDAVVKQLGGMKSLRKLELWNTELNTDSGERLAQMDGLETLVLYGQPVSKPLIRSICKMRSLQFLNLEHCELATGVFWELASRIESIDLDLSGSNVGDDDLEQLLPLRLTSLRIDETQLSEASRKTLRKRFGNRLRGK